MSFSSGAYRGSHSTESHGRAASARRLALLVWIGPLSSTSTTGRSGCGAWFRSSRPSRATRAGRPEQGDEVARALGGAGDDDQLAAGVVEHAEERPLAR